MTARHPRPTAPVDAFIRAMVATLLTIAVVALILSTI